MVEHADLVGVPFVYGARGPDAYDCFGLVRELYRRAHGIELPDFTTPDSPAAIDAVMVDQRASPAWQPCEPAPNTIVLLRVAGAYSHVGFMLDDEYFVHAWRDFGGVSVDRLDNWRTRIGGFYRYAG